MGDSINFNFRLGSHYELMKMPQMKKREKYSRHVQLHRSVMQILQFFIETSIATTLQSANHNDGI